MDKLKASPFYGGDAKIHKYFCPVTKNEVTLCSLCLHGDVCGDRERLSADNEKALVFCNDFKSCEEYVKVVRCKDCRDYKPNPYSEGNEKLCMCWADWIPTEPDDFCSYGERKEDD